jgi:hypothetical protein
VDQAALDSEIEDFVPTVPGVQLREMQRAVEVASKRNAYYNWAKQQQSLTPSPGPPLPETLEADEIAGLVAERERLFAHGKMPRAIITVCLCSFLQGFLQSSINAASLYAHLLGLKLDDQTEPVPTAVVAGRDWKLGAMNASVWFSGAFLGCPAALFVNHLVGRRGAM